MAKITSNLLFLVQKRFLRTSSNIPSLPQSTKAPNFPLHFLTDTCGLPLKSAISVSQKLAIQENNKKKLQSVVDFFKEEGFTQNQIAKLIQKRPKILHSRVETHLKLKLGFLKQNGIVDECLIELVVKDPFVLMPSVCSLMRFFELLKSYLKSDEKIVFAIRRNVRLLSRGQCRLQPNIDFLIKEGVPASPISKILMLQPGAMIQRLSKTICAVNDIKKLRLRLSSPIFVNAFRVMVSTNESTWKKKMEFLQSFGWGEEEILSAFKRSPTVMSLSVGRIGKSIDFYLNTVKLDQQTLITYPEFLCYAIDTRVVPRYIILKTLVSKKLIKKDSKFLCVLKLTEKTFLDRYVTKNEDKIPGLLEIYITSKKEEKKIGT